MARAREGYMLTLHWQDFSVFNWPCLKLCKEFLLLLRLVGSTVFPRGLCGPLYKHSVVLLVRFSSHLFVHH